jgi:hypothetical protein
VLRALSALITGANWGMWFLNSPHLTWYKQRCIPTIHRYQPFQQMAPGSYYCQQSFQGKWIQRVIGSEHLSTLTIFSHENIPIIKGQYFEKHDSMYSYNPMPQLLHWYYSLKHLQL